MSLQHSVVEGNGKASPMAARRRNFFGFRYNTPRKEKFMLFSDHKGSLLKRQPGAAKCKLRLKHSSAQILSHLHPSFASPGDGMLSSAGSQRDDKLRGKFQLCTSLAPRTYAWSQLVCGCQPRP